MNNVMNKQLTVTTLFDCGGSSSKGIRHKISPPHQDSNISIETLNRANCIAFWTKLTGFNVPKRLSVEFMRRALVYEGQCEKFGGLLPATKKMLVAVAAGKNVADASRQNLSVGTHLVRDWNGRAFQVEVVNDGFLLDGKKYKSLSAIARKITGARWSGPRFFGLTNNSKKARALGTNGADKFQTTTKTGYSQ